MAPFSAPVLLAAVLELTGAVGTHDPTIVKQGQTYYRFSTGDGIPIAQSADLRSWEQTDRVFLGNPAWTAEAVPGSTSFWAPEGVYRQGRWRVYYSVSTFGSQVSAIGLASSPTLDPTSPDYQWRDDGVVITSAAGDDFNAIDPAVIDDGQQDWLLWGSFWGGLKMRRLDRDTGKPPVGDDQILDIANRWAPPNSVEGGAIVFRDGWYYLFCSFDFCCRGLESTYRIAVGRSRSVTGPFLDKDGNDLNEGGGSIIRDGENDPRYAAVGHNSIFSDQGDQWLVFHGYDKRRHGAPILVLEKLLWDAEWPVSPGQLLKSQPGN